mmetsp:Transcript_32674/g.86970  ORF Transcript_32674/g.86970 Transcript_32674/m.86970 type:complete len:730 (+) Transcript_32674:96-2285(+)
MHLTPSDGDDLPAVLRAEVEGDLELDARMPSPDQPSSVAGVAVGAVGDDVTRTCEMHVGIERVGQVAIDGDSEELRVAPELLRQARAADGSPVPEHTGAVFVHRHRLRRPLVPGADDAVVASAPAVQALPDDLGPPLREQGDDDTAIVDLEAQAHELVDAALRHEVSALAEVVGPTGRADARGGSGPRWVDRLLQVEVPQELELLPARCPETEGQLPSALLIWALGEREGLPRCPRANHAISVPKLEGVLGEARTRFLPRNHLPNVSPPESQFVGRPGRYLLISAVDDPALAGPPVVGPLHPDVRGRIVHRRIQPEGGVFIQAQEERLASCLAQDDGARVVTIFLRLKLLHMLPSRPRAADARHSARFQQPHGFVQTLPAEPVRSAVDVAGDVVRGELVSEHVGPHPDLLAERSKWRLRWSGFPREVIDGGHADGTSHLDLVELLHRRPDVPPSSIRAVSAPAPDLGVRVRSRDAEGGHAGDDAVDLHVDDLVLEPHRPTCGVQVRVENPQVHIGWRCTVLAHKDTLDQADCACVGLLVAQVALRAGAHVRIVPGVRLLHAPQGADLDGVAQSCAGSVALRGRDVVGLDAGLPQRSFDAHLLRRTVGRRHAGAPAVLVEAAADDGRLLAVHVRAVAPLRVDHRRALALAVAVPRAVEGEATALDGDHVLGAAHYEEPRIQNLVHATSKCPREPRVQVALRRRASHGVHRGVERGQPRGACRVDHVVRTG